ncbi:MAG: hypothetical protein K9I94_04480 [Bacteroidales bacterium]|nr:hypothetical protein [Bacteroidales bacterium]
MKVKVLAIIVMLVASGANLATGNQTGEFFPLEDECTVDDIPFDTRTVFLNVIKGDSTFQQVFKMEEESPVNDIPFNTEVIAREAMASRGYSATDNPFMLEEEASVNDIPFDTKQIFNHISYNWNEVFCPGYNKLINCFSLSPESYIDDIPFDTFRVICITAK